VTPTLAPLKVAARGTVVASRPGTECQSHIAPWCCVLPGGRWLVSYRAARTKINTLQRAMVTWSDDEGRTWSEPSAPFADHRIAGKLGQFRHMQCAALGGKRLVASLWWVDASEPHKPFFNEKTEGIFDSQLFIAFSDDGGAHWSEPTPVHTEPFDRFPCPPTGPILLLPNGEWAAQFEPGRPYDRVEKHHFMSAFIFSRDQGKTWGNAVQPPHDPEHNICYGDQRATVLADGTLLDFFWTFDARTGQYLNIHASASKDSGQSWAPLWDTGVAGQPGTPAQLADGRIALVFIDRSGSPAVKVRLSDDGGRTFPASTEVIAHQPGLAPQTREKQGIKDMWAEFQQLYSIGHADSKALADGDLLATFYTGPSTDQTDIAWVRLSPRP
jgi:hypothetical protein